MIKIAIICIIAATVFYAASAMTRRAEEHAYQQAALNCALYPDIAVDCDRFNTAAGGEQ